MPISYGAKGLRHLIFLIERPNMLPDPNISAATIKTDTLTYSNRKVIDFISATLLDLNSAFYNVIDSALIMKIYVIECTEWPSS